MGKANKQTWSHKAFALFLSLALALSLSPFQALSASAEQGSEAAGENPAASEQSAQDQEQGSTTEEAVDADQAQVATSEGDQAAELATDVQASESEQAAAAKGELAQAQAAPMEEAGEITGGGTISASGTYSIKSGATGKITIDENLDVTLVGQGIEDVNVYNDLNIVVGNQTNLTIDSVYICVTDKTAPSAIDFLGKGSLSVVNENIIDRPNNVEQVNPGEFPALIHVGVDADVTFKGTGALYAYKYSLGSLIGGSSTQSADDPCGNITFESGTWCLNGSQTGPVLGGNKTSTNNCGTITINGGFLYVKTMSKAAAIGCSAKNSDGAPDIVINGGSVEALTDWSGSAIGRGGTTTQDAGTLTINGGTLKTICAKNAYSQWGITDETANAIVTSKVITATIQNGKAANVAELVFDATDLANDTIEVEVDDTKVYESTLPSLVTNEEQNPSGSKSEQTKNNWLENSAASAWDGEKGSSFAPDTNLRFWLTQEDHTLLVNDKPYTATWDASTGKFVVEEKDTSVDGDVWNGNIDISWYDPEAKEFTLTKPAQLAGLAAIVNGCYDDGAWVVGNSDYIKYDGYGGIDSFKDKTIKLGADLDMGGVYDEQTQTWSGSSYMPVGGQYPMHLSTGDATISASFNGTFDGQGHKVSNIYADRGSSQSDQSVGLIGCLGCHDNDAASLRADNPTVKNVVVSGYIKSGRSVGGIVGKIGKTNKGGTISQCVNHATIVSSQKKGVGGIVGAAWNGGSVANCYNTGSVSGGSPAGGIAGTCEIVISNCYNIGQVTSASGDNYAMGLGTLDAVAAGFMNCFWLKDVAKGGGIYNSVGATVLNCSEKTTEELKADEILSNLGSAFMKDTEGINDGYPVLRYEATTPTINAVTIAGDSRIQTAIEAAKTGYSTGADGVVVSTASNFPDALAATSLAGALDYPILLIDDDSVEDVTEAISDLHAAHALVIGSSSAVSSKAFRAIGKAVGGDVLRLSGNSRFETQMAIYDYGYVRNLWEGDPIFTTGSNFPDALSISSYASATKSPLFLVDGEEGLIYTAQEALVEEKDTIDRAIVLGGESSVPASVASWIEDALDAKVVRLAGGVDNSYPASRYGTSAAIANFCVEEGMSLETVGVAIGSNFPDALVAGPVLGRFNGPILLVNGKGDIDTTSVEAIADKASDQLGDPALNALFLGKTGDIEGSNISTEAYDQVISLLTTGKA